MDFYCIVARYLAKAKVRHLLLFLLMPLCFIGAVKAQLIWPGASVQTEYMWPELTYTSQGSPEEIQIHDLRSFRPGLAAGFNLESGLSDRFSLVTGLFHQRKAVNGNIVCTGCFITGLSRTVSISGWQIPLSLRWYVKHEDLRFFIEGGLATEYISKVDPGLGKFFHYSAPFNITLMTQAGAGIEIRLNRLITISIAPGYRQLLLDFTREAMFRSKAVFLKVDIAYKPLKWAKDEIQ